MDHHSAQQTDDFLLRRFGTAGDENAFAVLARRHAGMVYGVALRRTGHAGSAEEVTQNVFATLARKAAGFYSPGGVAVWLHRAAVLECANFNRREFRRANAMKRYADDPLSDAVRGPAHSAKEGIQELDELLNALPGAERALIFQRFYEGLTFEEIAHLTGRAPKTVRERLERALERLSALLRRRGVALPAVALGSLVAAELGKAAPSPLLASLPATVLSVSGTLTPTFVLFAMSTTKISFCAGVIFAVAIPAGYTWKVHQTSSQQSSTVRMEESIDRSATPKEDAVLKGPPFRNADGIDWELLAKELTALAGAGDDVPPTRVRTVMLLMLSLSAEEIPTAVGLVISRHPGADNFAWKEVLRSLATRWGEADASGAVASITGKAAVRGMFEPYLAIVVDQWAGRAPEEALAWLQDIASRDKGYYFPGLAAELFACWVKTDAKAAAAAAADLDRPLRTHAMEGIFAEWGHRDPGAMTAWLAEIPDEADRNSLPRMCLQTMSQKEPARALDIARRLKDPIVRRECLKFLAGQVGREESRALFLVYGELDPADRTKEFASAVGMAFHTKDRRTLDQAINFADTIGNIEERQSFAYNPLLSLSRVDAPRAAAELGWQPENDMKRFLSESVAEEWTRLDPVAAGEWLRTLPADSRARDYAYAAYAGELANRDPQAALAWVESIGRENRRAYAHERIARSWLKKDRPAAEQWIRQRGVFDEGTRAGLLNKANQ